MKKILEMRGKRTLTDERILKYINECINELKKIDFKFKDSKQFLTFDDIDFKEGDALTTYGTLSLPENHNSNFKLILNKYMFDDPEEVIKNTIYHELGHYVVSKAAIYLQIFYSKNNKWYINPAAHYSAADFKGHGKIWKQVSNIIGRATNQIITRTSSDNIHKGVGAQVERAYKYSFKCKHCGKIIKFQKKSNFVKDVLAGNGHADNWQCNCPDGYKSQDFEILKGGN